MSQFASSVNYNKDTDNNTNCYLSQMITKEREARSEFLHSLS